MMPNMDPRQMAIMMKRMGISQRDIDGVQSIVIRTATKEYRFTRAHVSVMTAQGTETWQIQGKPTVHDVAPAGTHATSGPTTAPATAPTMTPGVPTTAPPPAPLYSPTSDDIQTVMDAAGCSRDKAVAALKATGGDLAQAIVDLEG
jgi:nascent polypeptide-associated complex subunit alpha